MLILTCVTPKTIVIIHLLLLDALLCLLMHMRDDAVVHAVMIVVGTNASRLMLSSNGINRDQRIGRDRRDRMGLERLFVGINVFSQLLGTV